MNYISPWYYLLLLGLMVLYYIFPKKIRWSVLLAGSLAFLYLVCSKKQCLVVGLAAAAAYCFGILIEKAEGERKKLFLTLGILVSAGPLFLSWCNSLILTRILEGGLPLIIPVGLSFYSLQLIAYLTDVGRGKIQSQKNPFKFLLFVTFFPQIVQGPIPRYEVLEQSLYRGNRFDFDKIFRSILLIMWGFFLKMMIADKAAVYVNTVFSDYKAYSGFLILLAGILYSLQLYTDFQACTTLSRGAAGLFGVTLGENFDHPYFALSIQDFWRRWHISLSTWLKDYVYIPLGGSRKGKVRRYINLVLTFLVSGIWHGAGLQFIFWGLLHAFYQIFGGLTRGIRDAFLALLGMEKDSLAWVCLRRAGTFFWVMLAWIIFRADSLRTGLGMIASIFTRWNGGDMVNDAVFACGLDIKDWNALALSLAVLACASFLQEKKICIRDWIISQHLLVRWTIYLTCILTIWIFGTYGFGFNAQDFIYGGF
jgi:D-alanyl-lipoteichoic acid acyltransferase DltB (MBOAT superfamily)